MSTKLIVGTEGGRYIGRRRPTRPSDEVDASELASVKLTDVFSIDEDGSVDATSASQLLLPPTTSNPLSAATRAFAEAQAGGSTTMQYHVVYVAKDGDDATGTGSLGKPLLTVKAALAHITDNTETNRYVIKLGPGVYEEDNPLAMKSYVDVEGVAGVQQTHVVATNPGSVIFESAEVSTLSRVDAIGPATRAIECTHTGIFSVCNVSVSNCSCGLHVNNAEALVNVSKLYGFADTEVMDQFICIAAGHSTIDSAVIVGASNVTTAVDISNPESLVFLAGLVANSPAITNAVVVRAGADATLNGARITGDEGDRIGAAITVHGDGSRLDCLNTYVQHADFGVYADNDVDVHLVGISIDSCDEGIHTHVLGSPLITIGGGAVSNSITWDLYLSVSTANFYASGISMDEDKLYMDGANVAMAHISSNEGDEGLGVKGELHVGAPERGAESVFGEGDSYTRGLLAYSYDGASYLDVSEEVKSYDDSTFGFSNNDVDTAIYLGSDLMLTGGADYHKFYGIKMSLVTSQVGGEVAAEYWNGSAWSPFTHMTAESGGHYYKKANQLFNCSPGSYQVRNSPFIEDDWVKNDPAGTGHTRYWIRYRITSTLTSSPVFEQWKLHSSRTELNSDGYRETMGRARAYKGISIPWGTFNDAGTSVGSTDLWLSTNCKVGLINNNFNTNGDSVGTVFSLPP